MENLEILKANLKQSYSLQISELLRAPLERERFGEPISNEIIEKRQLLIAEYKKELEILINQ